MCSQLWSQNPSPLSGSNGSIELESDHSWSWLWLIQTLWVQNHSRRKKHGHFKTHKSLNSSWSRRHFADTHKTSQTDEEEFKDWNHHHGEHESLNWALFFKNFNTNIKLFLHVQKTAASKIQLLHQVRRVCQNHPIKTLSNVDTSSRDSTKIPIRQFDVIGASRRDNKHKLATHTHTH